jgi:hypothetical protein
VARELLIDHGYTGAAASVGVANPTFSISPKQGSFSEQLMK